MMTHHIGCNAREIILQKLVVQMQQRVFDVTLQWYVGNLPYLKQSETETALVIMQPLSSPRYETASWLSSDPLKHPLMIQGLHYGLMNGMRIPQQGS